MKLSTLVLAFVAAVALTACCYRPCPRPCPPMAPSYCAPVCAAPGPAVPVKKVYRESAEK
ncbi:MAG: hypothetical protein WCK47_06845 [bacterium]|nr:hypothetical protein [Candidatus Sumerlaeota bacterium]